MKQYLMMKIDVFREFRIASLTMGLRDFPCSQLAELRKSHGDTEDWEWTRIIGTPTSQCASGYLTAVDSY